MNTSAPIIQQHELTSRCNNNCGFCYNPERCWSGISTPRQEDEKRNLEIARLSVKKGVMASCLTGGEPFLVGEHLYDVIEIYKSADCYTSINSNGRLISKSVALKLAELGLNSALISIHGRGKKHDDMVGISNSFGETISGMINLSLAGVRVVPNFVATSKNVHGLIGLASHLKGLGFSSMTATPFLPSWAAPNHEQFIMQRDHYRDYFQYLSEIDALGLKIDSTLPIPPCVLIKFFPDDWESYLKVLSPRICMAGKSFGVVSPDGYFRSCIQAPYLPAYGGNVLDEYERSWNNANSWADDKLLPFECVECKALSICGGGCRTSSMWENSGCTAGKTMYMGRALNEAEAALFINRITLPHLPESVHYSWESSVKFRKESFGLIAFNQNNQSFCFLDKGFNKYLESKVMTISDPISAQVLMSAGIIKKNESVASYLDVSTIPQNTTVLPICDIFPRLAKGLPKDKAYKLRADTGERLYFKA